MKTKQRVKLIARCLTGAVGAAAASYGIYAAVAWHRYGRAKQSPEGDGADALLDCFMPDYEVTERHSVRVAAPGTTTFAAAAEMDLQQSRIVRALFKARSFVLGGRSEKEARRKPLVVEMEELGWGTLAETPGREIVFGAVTQPWKANVVFRALKPAEFASFQEPGYVKIAWTLRVDPTGENACIFRTETRAATTDLAARAKFRRYWVFFSAGIVLIRRVMLRLVKKEAESRLDEGRYVY